MQLFKRSPDLKWWRIPLAGIAVASTLVFVYGWDSLSDLVGSSGGLLLAVVFVLFAPIIIFIDLATNHNRWAGLFWPLVLLWYPHERGFYDYFYSHAYFILVIGVTAMLGYRGLDRDGERRNSRLMLTRHFPLLLFIFYGLGVSVSDDFYRVDYAFAEAILTISVLMFLYINRNKKSVLMEWMVVYGAMAVAVWCVCAAGIHPNKFGAFQPFFVSSAGLSAVLALPLPIILWLAYFKKGIIRVLLIGLSLGLLAGIVWQNEISGWLALLGGGIFFLWLAVPNWGLRVGLLLIAGSAMAWIFTTETYRHQREIRTQTWEQIWEYPLSQTVPAGHYVSYYKHDYYSSIRREPKKPNPRLLRVYHLPTEMDYLQILAERGIPGFLLWVGYLVLSLVFLGRLVQRGKLSRSWAAAIAAGIGTYILQAFVADLNREKPYWVALLLLLAYPITLYHTSLAGVKAKQNAHAV